MCLSGVRLPNVAMSNYNAPDAARTREGFNNTVLLPVGDTGVAETRVRIRGTARGENLNFTEELRDPDSELFRELEEEFCDQVRRGGEGSDRGGEGSCISDRQTDR